MQNSQMVRHYNCFKTLNCRWKEWICVKRWVDNKLEHRITSPFLTASEKAEKWAHVFEGEANELSKKRCFFIEVTYEKLSKIKKDIDKKKSYYRLIVSFYPIFLTRVLLFTCQFLKKSLIRFAWNAVVSFCYYTVQKNLVRCSQWTHGAYTLTPMLRAIYLCDESNDVCDLQISDTAEPLMITTLCVAHKACKFK